MRSSSGASLSSSSSANTFGLRTSPSTVTVHGWVTSDPARVELPTDGRAVGHAVASLDEALELARSLDDEIYVAGGGTIYRQAWPALTDLDLTEVDAAAEGTVRLPEIDAAEWQEVGREPRDGFAFVQYRRRDADRL